MDKLFVCFRIAPEREPSHSLHNGSWEMDDFSISSWSLLCLLGQSKRSEDFLFLAQVADDLLLR
jgi:hypothetical protein